jgi:hypothetical protein
MVLPESAFMVSLSLSLSLSLFGLFIYESIYFIYFVEFCAVGVLYFHVILGGFFFLFSFFFLFLTFSLFFQEDLYMVTH